MGKRFSFLASPHSLRTDESRVSFRTSLLSVYSYEWPKFNGVRLWERIHMMCQSRLCHAFKVYPKVFLYWTISIYINLFNKNSVFLLLANCILFETLQVDHQYYWRCVFSATAESDINNMGTVGIFCIIFNILRARPQVFKFISLYHVRFFVPHSSLSWTLIVFSIIHLFVDGSIFLITLFILYRLHNLAYIY